jgi:RimJ/RimL family protein N-acetyltransferase
LSSAGDNVNPLGQPIGVAVPGWTAPPRPQRTLLSGRYCRLEPLDSGRHAADLHAANSLDVEGRMWTYLFSGPFATLDEFTAWLESREDSLDPLYFAIVDAGTGRATGIASYLRIEPAHGTIEVGHLAFSPLLQRTPAATQWAMS